MRKTGTAARVTRRTNNCRANRHLRVERLESRDLLTTIPIATGEDFTLGLDESDTFAVLKFDDDRYASFRSAPQLRDASKIILESFEDKFDFLYFVMNEDQLQGGPSGSTRVAQNSTYGTGMFFHDDTDEFGSAGRLQSAIHIGTRGLFRTGPSLHELVHRWANQRANRMPQFGSGSHWNFSNIGGQLGGWKDGTLQDLGDGRYEADGPNRDAFYEYANGGNGIPYSEFELYLMGLIEAEEVTHPIIVARDAAFTDPATGEFTASRFDTYTMQDLIELHGRRFPDPVSSQREFRAMVVLVTGSDPSDEIADQMAGYVRQFSAAEDDGTDFIYNFWEATGGRASIKMDELSTAAKGTLKISRIDSQAAFVNGEIPPIPVDD